MISSLTDFKVTVSPWGSLLNISWKLPEILPDNYKVYVFKRSRTDVTQEEIAKYFANIHQLDNYNYNKLFVWDDLSEHITEVADYQVRNGITHYYKAVLRDETSGEISETVLANAIPGSLILVDILDGKALVAKSLEAMFDSLTNKKGERIKIGNEIKIVKQFTTGVPDGDQVMVERINGSTQYRFWGNQWAAYNSTIIKGDIDADVIRATFITPGNIERRDLVANIFRSRKQMLVYMLKVMGCKDAMVTVEGDYYNPMFHGENTVGITVIFSLLIVNKTKVPVEIINEHITNLPDWTIQQ